MGLSKAEDVYRQNKISGYEKRCAAGNDEDCLKLVDIFFQGKDGNISYPIQVDSSPFKTLEFLASSCQLGNINSCKNAANILDNFSGLFSPELFRQKACGLGDQSVCGNLDN